MAITNWNIPWVNRKSWQVMNPAPTATVAWGFVITDKNWETWNAMYVANATTQYWYSFKEDSWVQIPPMALAWTFWAWACWTYHWISNTYTATWGTTTTLTTTSTINWLAVGATLELKSWTAANLWLKRTVGNISSNAWVVTITLTVALPSAVVNTDTFVLSTGRFFIMNAWTTAAWIFKSFDIATWVVTSLWTTNLPASWGTDWRLISTNYSDISFVSWTATSWASTTLTKSTANWTVNQFTNYQIKITWGTWIWQIRTIASNTSTVITVSSAWTTNPDATSTFSIEWNEDYIYLLGNNAVTMYRYSISWNTWTVLSPWVARAWAPIAWMSWNWIGKTDNLIWWNENVLLDWRYIYSFRWGTSVLDRYDIVANSWSAITYNYAQETFTTWSSYDVLGGKIYIRKDATNRFFYYDIAWNHIFPFTTLLQTDWAAILWDKMWTMRYTDWTTNIDWVYSLANSWTTLNRVMII